MSAAGDNEPTAGATSDLIIEKFNLKITKSDVKLLHFHDLNDTIVDFYFNLIVERSRESPDLPKTYALNSYFYDKLLHGYDGVRRWTKNVDIFTYDFIIIPINIYKHWSLCLVDLKKKCVKYVDGEKRRNERCLEIILYYLVTEHYQKRDIEIAEEDWDCEHVLNVPVQSNPNDSGVFTITFAEYCSRNAAFDFTEADIPAIRHKVILEIKEGKLIN